MRSWSGETLILLPRGLDFATKVSALRAKRLGSIAIRTEVYPTVPGSFDHAIEILQVSDVRYIVTTPAILIKLLESSTALDFISRSVRHVTLYDASSLQLIRQARDLLPARCEMSVIHSCPSVLAEFRSTLVGENRELSFDSFAPYVMFGVESGIASSPTSGRGKNVVSHLSRWGFFPNVNQALRGTGLVPHSALSAVLTDVRDG